MTGESELIKNIKDNASNSQKMLDDLLLAYCRDNKIAISYTEATYTTVGELICWLRSLVNKNTNKQSVTDELTLLDLYNIKWDRYNPTLLGKYNGVDVYSNHFMLTNDVQNRSCVGIHISSGLGRFHIFDFITDDNLQDTELITDELDLLCREVLPTIKGIPVLKTYRGGINIFNKNGELISTFVIPTGG